MNVDDVTFPEMTTFPEATSDVSGFVNWIVASDVEPCSVAF